MLHLGIDPDLHHTGIALVGIGNSVIGVHCCAVPLKLTGAQAVVAMTRQLSGALSVVAERHGKDVSHVVVEGQTINFRQTANPANIIHLAHVTGAIVGIINELLIANIRIPPPREWKGQVPKQIHHQRILAYLGWPYDLHGAPKTGYASPIAPPVGKDIAPSHWKHVVDAIGLALWSRKHEGT